VNKPFYVILPAGTEIAAAGWKGAPSFKTEKPVAGLVTVDWESSFILEIIWYEDKRPVETNLVRNYVMQSLTVFSQGSSVDEAWANFHENS
jgi:hypothetical protein